MLSQAFPGAGWTVPVGHKHVLLETRKNRFRCWTWERERERCQTVLSVGTRYWERMWMTLKTDLFFSPRFLISPIHLSVPITVRVIERNRLRLSLHSQNGFPCLPITSFERTLSVYTSFNVFNWSHAGVFSPCSLETMEMDTFAQQNQV